MMPESYAAWQQRRGRLPDLIEEAIAIYDGFMKDDDFDTQRCLDSIVAKLRSARDWYAPEDAALSALPAIRGAVDLRKAVAQAIFDPGATEGCKGERTLTGWQTDAVMRALAAIRSTQPE